MTQQNQPNVAGTEPSLGDLKAPADARESQVSIEDKLALATAEIARLRTICYGDATIADKKTHYLSFPADGNVEIALTDKNWVPMEAHLKDLISQGQKIDVEVWSWHRALTRHDSPKYRNSETYKDLTCENIQPLLKQLCSNAARNDEKFSPYVRINYYQPSEPK